jgi:hypothetical protein
MTSVAAHAGCLPQSRVSGGTSTPKGDQMATLRPPRIIKKPHETNRKRLFARRGIGILSQCDC